MCKWDAAESMRVGEYIKVAYIDAEKACRIVELKILLYNKNKWSNEEKKKKEEKPRKRRWGRSGQKQGSDACGEREREREREREERKGAEMRKGERTRGRRLIRKKDAE